MNVKKLLLLYFRTTIREFIFPFIIIFFLFWSFINSKGLETFLKSQSLFKFYTLFTMVIVGYAIIVSLSFAGFLKRKVSKFYQLYFILPEKPSRFLIVEMLPIFTITILLTVVLGIILYYKAPSSSPFWLILPIMGSMLFILGFGMIFLALTLQISNIRAVNMVLFLFLFVLAKIPKYIINENLSLELVTNVLLAISILFALIGCILLERINPERVILSS